MKIFLEESFERSLYFNKITAIVTFRIVRAKRLALITDKSDITRLCNILYIALSAIESSFPVLKER